MAEESDKRVLTSEKVKELKWDADTVKFITTDMLSQYIDEENTQWTTIGQAAFSGLSNIISVQIPDNITTIDIGAFSGCTNLKSVTIGNNVIEIGSSAFKNCTSLLTIDTNNVSIIGSEAFYGCTSLNNPTIGNTVTSIKDGLFYGCTSLTNLTMPNGITSIGNQAFYGCTGLTTFPTPIGVLSIGVEAFAYCANLVTISTYNTLQEIGYHAFYECNSLNTISGIQYAGKYAVKVLDKTLSSYTLGSGTRWLGDDLFMDCVNITSFIIPDSVVEICGDVFHNCTNLSSITFGGELKKIGKRAFQNCVSLPNITIPSNVETIGDYAFYGCSGARYIEIANGCASIGFSTFSGTISYSETVSASNDNKYKAKASSTEGLCYSDGIKNPGYATAEGVHIIIGTDRIKSVSLPVGYYDIDDINVILHLNAFTNKETTVTIIETSEDEYGVPYDITHTVVVYNTAGSGSESGDIDWSKISWLPVEAVSVTPNLSKDTKVFIPASVTSIGKLAFENCRKLTTFVVDGGNNSYSVDSDVLFNKNKTTIICCPITKSGIYTIPNTVTTISEFAFARCAKLTQVDVPSNISTIYSHAFIGCIALDTMKVGATTYTKATVSSGSASNAYKAMPGNMVCLNFHYTPGTTYNYNTYDPDASVELCNGGFHACLRLCDVFNYYGGRRKTNSDTKPYGTFVVYRVNLSGISDVRNSKDSKVVASIITVTNDRIL